MTTPVTPEVAEYQPSAAQMERAASLRRFNWLYVYTPVALISLAVLTLVGLLFWGAFSGEGTRTREFASGLADIVIIVTTIPLMLLCVILPGAAIAYGVYASKQPKKPHGRVHVLMWRADALVTTVQEKTGGAMSYLTRPVIAVHAWAAYLRTLWQHTKKIISRS